MAGRITEGRSCSAHDDRNTFRATDDGGDDNHTELYKINLSHIESKKHKSVYETRIDRKICLFLQYIARE